MPIETRVLTAMGVYLALVWKYNMQMRHRKVQTAKYLANEADFSSARPAPSAVAHSLHKNTPTGFDAVLQCSNHEFLKMRWCISQWTDTETKEILNDKQHRVNHERFRRF